MPPFCTASTRRHTRTVNAHKQSIVPPLLTSPCWPAAGSWQSAQDPQTSAIAAPPPRPPHASPSRRWLPHVRQVRAWRLPGLWVAAVPGHRSVRQLARSCPAAGPGAARLHRLIPAVQAVAGAAAGQLPAPRHMRVLRLVPQMVPQVGDTPPLCCAAAQQTWPLHQLPLPLLGGRQSEARACSASPQRPQVFRPQTAAWGPPPQLQTAHALSLASRCLGWGAEQACQPHN